VFEGRLIGDGLLEDDGVALVFVYKSTIPTNTEALHVLHLLPHLDDSRNSHVTRSPDETPPQHDYSLHRDSRLSPLRRGVILITRLCGE
jgi:hypothetical protein